MTGIRAGSGGTGLIEGSRPGTGVTGGPSMSAYDRLILGLSLSMFVKPGPKGVGSDPADYDDAIAPLSLSMFVKPGPKGVGPDDSYAGVLATMSPARDYPLGTAPAATQGFASYEALLATKGRDSYYRGNFITGLTPVPSYAVDPAILALTPAAYWKLDDLTTAIVDSSGNARDGVADFAVVPRAEPGPDGRFYYQFQNDDDGWYRGLVTIPNDPVFSAATHAVTVVMLVKSDGSSPTYPIQLGVDTKAEWQVFLNAMWNVEMKNGYAGLSDAEFDVLKVDEWQLVVARIPHMTARHIPELFVDSDTPTPPDGTSVSGSGSYVDHGDPLYFGGSPASMFYGMNGAMAHVAVYDKYLTNAEVKTIYDAAIEDGWISEPTLDEVMTELAPLNWMRFDTDTVVNQGPDGASGAWRRTPTVTDGVYEGDNYNSLSINNFARPNRSLCTQMMFVKFPFPKVPGGGRTAYLWSRGNLQHYYTARRDYAYAVPFPADAGGPTVKLGNVVASGGSDTTCETGPLPLDEDWHHVCWQIEGLTWRWYFDGVEVATGTLPGVPNVGTVNQDRVLDFQNTIATPNAWFGYASNWAEWSSILTPAEIMSIASKPPTAAAAPAGLDSILATYPRFYWPIANEEFDNSGWAGTGPEPQQPFGGPIAFAADELFGNVPVLTDLQGFATDAATPPAIARLELNTGFTLGAFVKLDGTNDTAFIVECGNTPAGFSQRNFDFYVTLSTGTITFLQYSVGGTRTPFDAVGVYPDDGAWHFVAVRYDLTTVRVFVDGLVVLDTPHTVAQNSKTTQRVVLGQTDTSGSGVGPGAAIVGQAGRSAIPSIVHAFISGGDVTNTQIAAIWAEGSTYPLLPYGERVTALAPVNLWKFNEASGPIPNTGTGGAGSAAAVVVPTSPAYQSVLGPDGLSYVGLAGGNHFVVPNHASLTGEFSVAMLVKINNDPTVEDISIYGKADAAGEHPEYSVYSYSDDAGYLVKAEFSVEDLEWGGYSTFSSGESPNVADVGEWNLIIVTLDETIGSFIYLNSPTRTHEPYGPYMAWPGLDINSDLTIGTNGIDDEGWVDGSVAWFAMFDRVLNEAEREALVASAVADGWITQTRDAAPPLDESITALAPEVYYKLNDASPGPAIQSGSGGAGVASAVGAVSWRSDFGPDGNIYAKVNGAGYLSAPDHDSLNGTQITAMILFRPDEFTTFNVPFSKADGSNGEFILEVANPTDGSSSTPVMRWSNTVGGTYLEVDAVSPLRPSERNMAIVTLDTVTGIAKFWLNDETAPASAVSPVGTYRSNGTGPLWLGAGPGGTQRFRGVMDHFAMWQRVLTDEEITWLLYAGKDEGWIW